MNDSTSQPAPEQQSPSALRITLGFAIVMAVVAGLQRYFPHPFNLTLIGALALWGGARLRPWFAVSLPLLVWGATELAEWKIKGNPSFNLLVCAGFLTYALLGVLLRGTKSPARIGAICVLGSV